MTVDGRAARRATNDTNPAHRRFSVGRGHGRSARGARREKGGETTRGSRGRRREDEDGGDGSPSTKRESSTAAGGLFVVRRTKRLSARQHVPRRRIEERFYEPSLKSALMTSYQWESMVLVQPSFFMSVETLRTEHGRKLCASMPSTKSCFILFIFTSRSFSPLASPGPTCEQGVGGGGVVGVVGCCWLLLVVVGCCWLLLVAVGCCWLLWLLHAIAISSSFGSVARRDDWPSFGGGHVSAWRGCSRGMR